MLIVFGFRKCNGFRRKYYMLFAKLVNYIFDLFLSLWLLIDLRRKLIQRIWCKMV